MTQDSLFDEVQGFIDNVISDKRIYDNQISYYKGRFRRALGPAKEENEKLKERIKYLENLIAEYTGKIMAIGKPTFDIHPIDKEIEDNL